MASLFNPSELYALLAQYGGLPQVASQRPVSGSRGEYLISENRIVAPSVKDAGFPSIAEGRRSTLAHEMSHAVQFQLFFDAARRIQEKIRNKEKVSSEEKQFLDSAQKMYLDSFGTIDQGSPKETQKRRENLEATIRALYKPSGRGDKMDSYDYYRTSPIELQSFGIGRMTEGGNKYREYANENPHLDPSFATEFALLNEQFKRLPEDVKIRNPKRDQFFQAERKGTDKEQLYKFEDLTSDPFKPTLK